MFVSNPFVLRRCVVFICCKLDLFINLCNQLATTQLEEYGFCQRGEAKDFLRSGEHLLTGSLPINTHGGQLGEAYIHGMNGVAEGVRQIRGQSVNQVDNVQHVLVTAGTGVPTSGLLLGAEN